jgi:hypothetical protein
MIGSFSLFAGIGFDPTIWVPGVISLAAMVALIVMLAMKGKS